MKTSNEGKRILKYISRFLTDYAPYIRSCSDHTLRNYKTALDQYLEWLEDVQNIRVNTLTEDSFHSEKIELWIAWLVNNKGQSKTTANVRLSSLRVFIHYLSRQDPKYRYLSLEAKEVRPLKTPKRKIRGISREAVKALLSVISTSTKTGKRYLILISLIYTTGARLDEVLSIQLDDIHLDNENPYIILLGKGSKYRNVPLVGNIVKMLSYYISSFHVNSSECILSS